MPPPRKRERPLASSRLSGIHSTLAQLDLRKPPPTTGDLSRMELKPTTKVGEALALAQREAQGSGHPEITPAHLALALAEQPDTTTPALLAAGGTSAEGVATAARHTLSSLPRTSGTSVQTPGL